MPIACPVADRGGGSARLRKRLVEGPLLAARTTAEISSTTPQRISFAKINEVLEVPKLLSLQTDSFNWLIGNDDWLAQVAAREAAGEDVSHKSGLQEIF